MIRRILGTVAVVATLAVPAIAQAQGVPGGIERGARDGERAAGPVGAIVGGTIGGVVGVLVGAAATAVYAGSKSWAVVIPVEA